MTSKPGVEPAKWLAFALMIGDHVNGYLLDYRYPAIYMLGRLVFPLFALALAEGLAGRGQLTLADTLKRLLIWGAISQVPWQFVTGAPGLNILFSLASGVALHLAIFGSISLPRRVLYGVGALAVAAASEYGIAGLAMVSTALWWRERPSIYSHTAFVVSLAALVAVNGTFFAVLAWPLWFALRHLGEWPRWRHLFYYLYPAHFLVIGFVRFAL